MIPLQFLPIAGARLTLVAIALLACPVVHSASLFGFKIDYVDQSGRYAGSTWFQFEAAPSDFGNAATSGHVLRLTEQVGLTGFTGIAPLSAPGEHLGSFDNTFTGSEITIHQIGDVWSVDFSRLGFRTAVPDSEGTGFIPDQFVLNSGVWQLIIGENFNPFGGAPTAMGSVGSTTVAGWWDDPVKTSSSTPTSKEVPLPFYYLLLLGCAVAAISFRRLRST